MLECARPGDLLFMYEDYIGLLLTIKPSGNNPAQLSFTILAGPSSYEIQKGLPGLQIMTLTSKYPKDAMLLASRNQ